MQRTDFTKRANWQERVEEAGLSFHTTDGNPYWDETSAYALSSQQAEMHIEAGCEELHEMCMEATRQVAASEELLHRIGIPEPHFDLVAGSLRADDPDLLGRFDLIYDGISPPKMIEYNADTPVTLLETSDIQWDWLQDQIAAGVLCSDSDQINDLFEAVSERFAEITPGGQDIHFAALGDADSNPEDYLATETLAWAAKEAGHRVHFTRLDEIGITDSGQFADDENQIIGSLFKLYPWEDMLRDEFAQYLAGAQCRYFEPPWKAITSSKGLLPVLWEMFEGHPNLLPTFFADDLENPTDIVARSSEILQQGQVLKPIASRQGASVTISENGKITERSNDKCFDDHPLIAQAYAAAPVFDGFRPVFGGWIVKGKCVGLGIREDRSRITQDHCRFKPHFISG